MKWLACGTVLALAACSSSETEEEPLVEAHLTIGTGALPVATGALVAVHADELPSITGLSLSSSNPAVLEIAAYDDRGGPIVVRGRSHGTAVLRMLDSDGQGRAAQAVSVVDPVVARLAAGDGRPSLVVQASGPVVRRVADSILHFAIDVLSADNLGLQGQLELTLSPGADAIWVPNSGAGELILRPTTSGPHAIELRVNGRVLTTLEDIAVAASDVVSATIDGSTEQGLSPGAQRCVSAISFDGSTHFVGAAWPWRADNVALGTGDSVCYTYTPDVRATLLSLEAPGGNAIGIHGTNLRVRVSGEP